jgi:hypothetical protein
MDDLTAEKRGDSTPVAAAVHKPGKGRADDVPRGILCMEGRLNKLGHQVASRELQAPEAFGAFQKVEADKWWPIIKAANIKID